MDKEELETLLDQVADRAIERHQKKYACALDIDKETHEEEHRFVRRLMELSDKIDALQWGVLSKVIVSLVLAVFVVCFFGGLIWILARLPR